jgi:exopolysaccharide biosynthesis polyprenyl glycosylphosphotransferase
MFKEKARFKRRLLYVLDMITISFSFFFMFFLRKVLPEIYPFDILPNIYVLEPTDMTLSEYFIIYLILLVMLTSVLRMNGMYSTLKSKTLSELGWEIIKSVFIVTAAFGTLVFMFKFKFVSRFFFFGFMAVFAVTLFIERCAFFFIDRHGTRHEYNRVRLLIVGTGTRSTHLIEEINTHPWWGYHIQKIVDLEKCLMCKKEEIDGCEVVSTPEQLREILHEKVIDQVIFEVPKRMLNMVENYIYVCQEEGVDVSVGIDFFDIKTPDVHITEIDGIPLLTFERSFGQEWQLLLKRTMDVFISGAGMILLSPVLLLTALLIKLTSPGPAIYKQKRVGLHGRIFTLYKFRSMTQDAEKKLEDLKGLNEMDGPVFKIKNDPRITPVGRILRRTSIDELPQLFNVLTGKLSLVGPRPPLPDEVKMYTPHDRKRLSMRPGITCLWQAYHRGEKDFHKWVESDMHYIDNWSLRRDFKIFVRTIITVLSGRGAY